MEIVDEMLFKIEWSRVHIHLIISMLLNGPDMENGPFCCHIVECTHKHTHILDVMRLKLLAVHVYSTETRKNKCIQFVRTSAHSNRKQTRLEIIWLRAQVLRKILVQSNTFLCRT